MAAVIRNKAAKKKLLKYIICFIICLAVVIVSFSFLAASVSAESSITLDISSGEADENSSVLDILFFAGVSGADTVVFINDDILCQDYYRSFIFKKRYWYTDFTS